MTWLFSPPSLDDLIRLLKAWRFWLLGSFIGALIGAAVFYFAPPPYSARATVLVDFNLEEAWPQEADRQQFFYLEREARKLEEIAWSDDVLQAVAESDGMTTGNELRDKKLKLSQPAEGGWHFYADDYETRRAQRLASEWALIFAENVKENVENSAGLNSFIQVDATQTENLPFERSVSLSVYLFAGAISFLFLSSLFVLFFSLTPTLSQKERE
jgi:pimeloyl-ACP methyl ester carboxylesterase